MGTGTEVATQGKQPDELIRIAVEKGANLEQLEKVLALQERWEQNEAKKAFYQAMASFKSEAPRLIKDKKVNTGSYKYAHASLFGIVEKVSPVLSKWGLSASWRTTQNGQVTVTCRITHKQGYFEETSLSAPADNSGAKNAIQQIGSTVTYLERYTFLAITGLAAHDQDDDGRGSEKVELISEKEYSSLIDHINNEGLDEKKVCEFLKVDDLRKLPKSELAKAMRVKKAAAR